MNIFHCPKCNETSYSAYNNTMECPYCSGDKLLIINPDILKMGVSLSNAKVIIDRRLSSQAVEVERRGKKVCIPVGWFVKDN